MQEFIERIALKLLLVGVVVMVFVAVVSMGGCGMISGLAQDIGSASNAIAESANRTAEARKRADREDDR